MSNQDQDRRSFLHTAAMTLAATQFGILGSVIAQSGKAKPAARAPSGPEANSSFGPLKQIDAGVLNIGYAEDGPANGPAVLLIHGWPYDIHSYADTAPLLAAKGYRVIVPYLRGFGTTRFLSADTFRNAQQAVVALDMIALLDALKIEKAIIAGYDWGSRTADIMAALWPERCKALVAVSGYLITNLAANTKPLPPVAEYAWWYQYYFSTERGRIGYEANRHDFNKLIWKICSPKWNFDDATFDRSAAAFDNPDHVAIVIHNYRWRLSLAPGDPQYDDLEKKLNDGPVITVPTITIGTDFDGAAANGAGYAKKILRQIWTPDIPRHRSQCTPGSCERFCAGYYRCRCFMSGQHPALPVGRSPYLFSSQRKKLLAFSLATSNLAGTSILSFTNNLRAK